MAAKSNKIPISSHPFLEINDWYQSPLGLVVLDMEKKQIKPYLARIFGEFAVQLGGPSNLALLEDSPIIKKIYMGSEINTQHILNVQTNHDQLPLLKKSLDAIVLAHWIDCVYDPIETLHEIYSALKPNGICISLSFNPFSSWGLLHLKRQQHFPWSGYFHTLERTKNWFKQIGFTILKHDNIFFRPPLQNPELQQRLFFLEGVGQFCFSCFGAVHVIVAQKRVKTMTPLSKIWVPKKVIFNNGYANPTTRTS